MDNETEQTAETEPVERRRGRPPGIFRPSGMIKVMVMVDPADAEWAKAQAEGMSGMVRRLLAEAHEKAEGKQR